ncbi:hypothetical protein ACMDCT_13205 [Halomonadaceae bacterium KBTZ08]
MNKRVHCAGYLVWILGLALVIVADSIIRQISGAGQDLGLPESVWFLSHLVLGVIAISCVSISLKSSKKVDALIYMIAALLAGSFYYVAMTWLYIVGTGIDSV